MCISMYIVGNNCSPLMCLIKHSGSRVVSADITTYIVESIHTLVMCVISHSLSNRI